MKILTNAQWKSMERAFDELKAENETLALENEILKARASKVKVTTTIKNVPDPMYKEVVGLMWDAFKKYDKGQYTATVIMGMLKTSFQGLLKDKFEEARAR